MLTLRSLSRLLTTKAISSLSCWRILVLGESGGFDLRMIGAHAAQQLRRAKLRVDQAVLQSLESGLLFEQSLRRRQQPVGIFAHGSEQLELLVVHVVQDLRAANLFLELIAGGAEVACAAVGLGQRPQLVKVAADGLFGFFECRGRGGKIASAKATVFFQFGDQTLGLGLAQVLKLELELVADRLRQQLPRVRASRPRPPDRSLRCGQTRPPWAG